MIRHGLLLIFILFASAFSLAQQNLDVQDGERAPTQDSSGDGSASAEKVIQIHHPNAAKGLIRINDDKSYQYKVKMHDKGSAISFGLSTISPPKITNAVNGTTYNYSNIYNNTSNGNGCGSSVVCGVNANYEWIPFHRFGSWGVILESGLSFAHGHGILASTPPQQAEESYTLFIIPLTVMVKYRFEYFRKQWFVPYVEGGATYYGLLELRSDNQQTNIAGSPAAGGGGGIAINISKGSSSSVFALDREYGISDMWLNIEGRAMAGLKSSLDFTNTTVNVGITVDY